MEPSEILDVSFRLPENIIAIDNKQNANNTNNTISTNNNNNNVNSNENNDKQQKETQESKKLHDASVLRYSHFFVLQFIYPL
jgi:hypothetical protein